jgi:glycosyltransferase involved in cell wall biosynthesis
MANSILQMVKGIDIGGANGGAEIFGIRLSHELAKRGWLVTLCAVHRNHTEIEWYWQQILEQEGIQVTYLFSSQRGSLFAGIRHLRSDLNLQKLGLIHSHSQEGTLIAIFWAMCQKANIIIRTAHTPREFGTGIIGGLSRFFCLNFLYPVLVRYEIGVTQNIVDILDRRWLAVLLGKKASKIYNGSSNIALEESSNHNFIEQLVSSTETSWLIASVGVFTKNKRFDLLIRALPGILEKIPHSRLLLIGSGPERQTLETLARSFGVADRVLFLGQRTDVINILMQCNLFALPSVVEGFSTAIIEAMQAKIPVIAADIPGNRELIQDDVNGILVPPGDLSALEGAIIHVHQHPEVGEQFVQKSLEKIESFNIDKTVDEYIKVYQRALAGQA